MFIPVIDLPEQFRDRFAAGDFAGLCEAHVATPEEHFARGLARLASGRYDDAQSDLSASVAKLGDVARIELAFLDVRRKRSLDDAADLAAEIAERSESNPRLCARAHHVLGLAEGTRRDSSAALDALLEALAIYRALGEKQGTAQVNDSLGMVEAARGRLDTAVHFYAMSLVDKTISGDRWGMATTLGNLGRLHLKAGRWLDAIGCFERDLELSRLIGDVRGMARMHEDLGRTYLELEQLDEARTHLVEALERALKLGVADIVCYAYKDLARLEIRCGNLDAAEKALKLGEGAQPPNAAPYFEAVFLAVRGELYAALGRTDATDYLRPAVEMFGELQLPDQEIEGRLTFAKVLANSGHMSAADKCLRTAGALAREPGYERYRQLVNEARATIIGPDDDDGDDIVFSPTPPTLGARIQAIGDYLVRKEVGGGGFGKVVHAYDTMRCRDVALKTILLEGVSNPHVRERRIQSAYNELRAVKKICHPGVNKVWAIGRLDEGFYVVQDFVDGQPLDRAMQKWADKLAPESLIAKVIFLLKHMSGALQALHAKGVIHRDLKPANVILRKPDGRPVLVDMGIAHVPTPDLGEDPFAGYGTRGYMSPEQIRADPLDGRSDLYSLGVVVYEILTGELPIAIPRQAKKSECESIVRTAVVTPLIRRCPKAAGGLNTLVMSLLAKTPDGRPASAQAVANLADKFVAS